MRLSKFKCPYCGAEMTDHYGKRSDPWGWIERNGERLRCEGNVLKDYFTFTDENGIEQKRDWRTRSCGWFTVKQIKKEWERKNDTESRV